MLVGIKTVKLLELAHSCVCYNQSGALCHTSLPYAGTLALFLGKLFILNHTRKTLLAKQWLSLFSAIQNLIFVIVVRF